METSWNSSIKFDHSLEEREKTDVLCIYAMTVRPFQTVCWQRKILTFEKEFGLLFATELYLTTWLDRIRNSNKFLSTRFEIVSTLDTVFAIV